MRVRACGMWAGSVVLAAMGASAHAAGGHHSVDDAALIEPGHCEVETWGTREHGGERLAHAGLACRAGPVELGLATDHARGNGASSTAQGLQVKWARELAPGVSAGFSVTGGRAAQERPHYQGATIAALMSWAVRDRLNLHVNVGRDFLRSQPDMPRSGVAVDWAPASASWLVAAERYLQDETHFARVGLRWFASDRWSLDASRAQSLRGPRPSSWTVAATWNFAR